MWSQRVQEKAKLRVSFVSDSLCHWQPKWVSFWQKLWTLVSCAACNATVFFLLPTWWRVFIWNWGINSVFYSWKFGQDGDTMLSDWCDHVKLSNCCACAIEKKACLRSELEREQERKTWQNTRRLKFSTCFMRNYFRARTDFRLLREVQISRANAKVIVDVIENRNS